MRFIDADLSLERAERVNHHLCQCQTCSRLVQQLRSLVEDLAAPLAVELDVAAHVAGVMSRLDQTTALPRRARTVSRFAAFASMAASVALLAYAVGRHQAQSPWQARGGPSAESLSRDVGVQVYMRSTSLQPLRPGDVMAPGTALTAGLRNLGHAEAHVLLFAVDAKSIVHWITPEYSQAQDDPEATILKTTLSESLLPTSVVFDDMAPGPLRIVTVVSPVALRVRQVERLSELELSHGSLVQHFNGAEVREIAVRVEAAPNRGTP